MSWNITLFIGVALLTGGTVLALREHQWIKRAQTAPGTVIEMIPSRGSKGGTNYAPRVQLITRDGSTHEFIRNYSSSPADFAVGDHVAVAYSIEMNDYRILTFGQRFGFAVILAGMGLSLVIMASAFVVGRQFVPRIYLPSGQSTNTQQMW